MCTWEKSRGRNIMTSFSALLTKLALLLPGLYCWLGLVQSNLWHSWPLGRVHTADHKCLPHGYILLSQTCATTLLSTASPEPLCILLTDTYFYSELLTGCALLTGHSLLTIHIYYQLGMHLHSPDMPVLHVPTEPVYYHQTWATNQACTTH